MSPKDTSKITTVKLNSDTKNRIDKLRVYQRESYDEILQRMLLIINTTRTNPERARAALMRLERDKRSTRKMKDPQFPPLPPVNSDSSPNRKMPQRKV